MLTTPSETGWRSRVASQALFRQRLGHPYYIVAPRFLDTSAGIRALYMLCHALNSMGEESFIVLNRPTYEFAPAGLEGLRAPVLSQPLADQHQKSGRTPVVIYPETSQETLGGGVSVFYLLNYLGLLGGPETLPPCDYVLAYSENLARHAPRCDGVLYIPASDPDFWTPGPAAERTRACVYTGKFVDYHGERLPDGMPSDALVITRDKAHSQDRETLRAIFRSSTALYVFENTALATEAPLCGCPVVCMRNGYFSELIAEQELGVDGFAWGDAPADLARATATVSRFRQSYLRSVEAFGPALVRFVEQTQALAATRRFEDRFRIPVLRSTSAIDAAAAQLRRVAVAVHEIGFASTLYRGSRGLARRAVRRLNGAPAVRS